MTRPGASPTFDPGGHPRRGCIVSLLTGALTVSVVVFVGLLVWGWLYYGPGPANRDTTVILRRGAGVAEIGAALKREHVIGSAAVFDLTAEITGEHRRLKAGEYAFPAHASLARVLGRIASGLVVRHFVTLPEGRTSAQAAAILRANPVLAGDVATPPEGALLPDTYEVTRGELRVNVIQRMRAARDALVAELWAHRRPDLPFHTPDQAVTLASIVEKETALASERNRVAAVYINRLRKGMKLDADPTTIYGISHGEPLGRGLRQSELLAATPYNTYVAPGLPPTPIANPGRASLQAVFNPAPTQDLYFVANGTGGSSFAATLDEHARNVARWRHFEAARAHRRAACPGAAC